MLIDSEHNKIYQPIRAVTWYKCSDNQSHWIIEELQSCLQIKAELCLIREKKNLIYGYDAGYEWFQIKLECITSVQFVIHKSQHWILMKCVIGLIEYPFIQITTMFIDLA